MKQDLASTYCWRWADDLDLDLRLHGCLSFRQDLVEPRMHCDWWRGLEQVCSWVKTLGSCRPRLWWRRDCDPSGDTSSTCSRPRRSGLTSRPGSFSNLAWWDRLRLERLGGLLCETKARWHVRSLHRRMAGQLYMFDGCRVAGRGLPSIKLVAAACHDDRGFRHLFWPHSSHLPVI